MDDLYVEDQSADKNGLRNVCRNTSVIMVLCTCVMS